jgi:DNA polymerase
VHDEIVAEADADRAYDALNLMLEIMRTPISWAPGLPLKAAGFVCDYYKKD